MQFDHLLINQFHGFILDFFFSAKPRFPERKIFNGIVIIKWVDRP